MDHPGKDIPNSLCIRAYMHCRLCLHSIPAGESPESWARLSVGWTDVGLQIWCSRHEVNVAHIDFEGETHPANATARIEH